MEKVVLYGGTKYKAQEMICDACGKQYLAPIRWLKSRVHHYCCKKCAAKGHHLTVANAKKATWLEADHYCEHCGKQITTKFGSGRFCSAECAHSRQPTEDTKQKLHKH